MSMLLKILGSNCEFINKGVIMKNLKFAATTLALMMFGGVQAQTVIDFSSARGTGTGTDRVLVENIRMQIPVVNPFNPSATTTVETMYNVTFKFDYTTLHLVPEAITQTGGSGTNNCATAQVQVYNAVQGVSAPLSGATITLGGQTVTTNSLGVATLTGLPSGAVSVGVTANGYVAASQTATLGCTTAANTVTIALSPSTGAGSLVSGQFRVILTWGQNPDDIDSHLTGPAADGTRWHVYFSAKTGGDMCGLDVDDMSSYGPETTTCPRTGSATTLRPGVYRYSVHHYDGTTNIGTSGANVRLEFGNGTVYNYTPPAATYAGSKDVWTVFELTVNSNGSVSVAPVNTISSSSSASGVRSANPPSAGGFGSPESPALFDGLRK